MKYRVEFKAEISGTAYVEAENSKEAYKLVRSAIEPNYSPFGIINDVFESKERYDINPKKVKSRDEVQS